MAFGSEWHSGQVYFLGRTNRPDPFQRPFGDGGNDSLYGDYNGTSTLHGGAGDDLLVTRDSATQQLFGDGGRDAAIADSDDVLTSIEA